MNKLLAALLAIGAVSTTIAAPVVDDDPITVYQVAKGKVKSVTTTQHLTIVDEHGQKIEIDQKADLDAGLLATGDSVFIVKKPAGPMIVKDRHTKH